MYLPTAVQKNAMPSAATALAAKQTAMYIDGSWNHLDLMNSGCNWGVGVLPIDENYTTFFDGGSLIIFKSTKHLEASENFICGLQSRKFRKNHRIIQNFMDACTDRILY